MPDQPVYPGVYIEEIPGGGRSIAGVPTAVTAFLGTAWRGPLDMAIRIGSFADFARVFGGLSADAEMSYGVRQFFLNGGSDAWIVRVAKNALPATRTLLNSTPIAVLKVTARDAGLSGNDIEVRVDFSTSRPDSTFNISFNRRSDGRLEEYAEASMNSADERYLPKLVNELSELVTASRDIPRATLSALPAGTSTSGALGDVQSVLDAAHTDFRIVLNGLAPVTVSLALPDDIAGRTPTQRLTALAKAIRLKVQAQAGDQPALARFSCTRSGKTLVMKSGTRGENSSVRILPGVSNDAAGVLKLGLGNGGTEIDAVACIRPAPTPDPALLAGGSELPCAPGDIPALFVPARDRRAGLYALDNVDLFNVLVMPGIADPVVLDAAVDYCRERRAFLIVDAPPAATDAPGMQAAISGGDLPLSDHAAVYFPWFYLADPLHGGQRRLTAPGGTLAGLYARTDASRGVWKAPAGMDATLFGVQALALTLSDAENGNLNPLGVNCLRSFPNTGPVAWGARTLGGSNDLASDYKYVPVRRLALHIAESIQRGTQWVAFEPNDESTWAQIRANVDAFMYALFRQGAFQGTSPRDAYLVKCDAETTTQSDIASGVVNFLVGFAPLKPAEFVMLKIRQLLVTS